MKKVTIAALAALSILGQVEFAQAQARSRDGKVEGVRRIETRRAVREATEGGQSVGAAATGSAAAVTMIRALDSASIGTRLRPEQSRRLQENISTKTAVRDAVQEVLALTGKAELRPLIEATVEGFSNLKEMPDLSAAVIAKMDPTKMAELGYSTLVLTWRKAVSWTGGENGAQTNFTKILTEANNQIASGRMPGDALIEAVRLHLKEQKKGIEPSKEEIQSFIENFLKSDCLK